MLLKRSSSTSSVLLDPAFPNRPSRSLRAFCSLTRGLSKKRLCTFCVLFSLAASFIALLKTNDLASAWKRHYKMNTGLVHEDLVQTEAMENVTRFLQNDTRKFVTLSFNSCGGLANMIWRFASIYGIGRQIGRRPFIDHHRACWKQTMPEFAAAIPFIQNATIYQEPKTRRKVDFGTNCCKADNVSMLLDYETVDFLYLSGNILQSYCYFHAYKPEIRAIFEFSPSLKEYVRQHTLAMFSGDSSHKLCVHTRLGDFKKHFLLESRHAFTNPALEFVGQELKKELNNASISVVLIGQDSKFLDRIKVRGYFRKYKLQNLNRAGEIYFGLAMCDSLLLTASGSTFGWWMGYLMPERQQERVFYNYQASKDKTFGKDLYDFDTFPPEWRRLRLYSNQKVAYEHRWHFQINADDLREGRLNTTTSTSTTTTTTTTTTKPKNQTEPKEAEKQRADEKADREGSKPRAENEKKEADDRKDQPKSEEQPDDRKDQQEDAEPDEKREEEADDLEAGGGSNKDEKKPKKAASNDRKAKEAKEKPKEARERSTEELNYDRRSKSKPRVDERGPLLNATTSKEDSEKSKKKED